MKSETLESGREAARAPAEVEFRDIFAASYQRLVVQMYGVTGDAAEAEDLVQEAFVRAAAAGPRFLTVDNPEAWLRAVAINVQRSHWRKLRNFSRIRKRLARPPTDLPASTSRTPAARPVSSRRCASAASLRGLRIEALLGSGGRGPSAKTEVRADFDRRNVGGKDLDGSHAHSADA
jgi:DNA-directed RNA polymerase specialized sigma24 family protein